MAFTSNDDISIRYRGSNEPLNNLQFSEDRKFPRDRPRARPEPSLGSPGALGLRLRRARAGGTVFAGLLGRLLAGFGGGLPLFARGDGEARNEFLWSLCTVALVDPSHEQILGRQL